MEVMGLMLGEFVDPYTVRVVDVFAMPQSGTTVSVEAVDPVFQADMMAMLSQTGRYARSSVASGLRGWLTAGTPMLQAGTSCWMVSFTPRIWVLAVEHRCEHATGSPHARWARDVACLQTGLVGCRVLNN